VKILIPLVVLSCVLILGCVGGGKEPKLAYIPPTPKELFSIGAFKPSKTEYNFKHYDGGKVATLLASVDGRFSDGDIVAVDGLKWQKNAGAWEPIPNPPIPVLKQGDNADEYLSRYAEWIEDHPHFGYPPLPIGNKK
jgi:hypothetical protein